MKRCMVSYCTISNSAIPRECDRENLVAVLPACCGSGERCTNRSTRLSMGICMSLIGSIVIRFVNIIESIST